MNHNLNAIEISGIRKFYNKVREVNGAISLTLGQPDFPVPKGIKEEIVRALEENKTVYTPNAGIDSLRREISLYLKERGIKYKEEDICITVGGSEGLYSVISALINPKDKVLIPNPSYPAYENIVKILGGEVINYSLKENFTLDIKEIEKALEENNIKVLVLSFPTNPTGAILSKKDREDLFNLLKDKDIAIITDEIYEALCFEEYYSIAQKEEVLDKVIYVSGFSKMFSMTGLRVGYFCAKEPYMKNIMKVHQYNVSCAPSIAQYGVLYGLKHCKEDVKIMKEEFIRRKDYVVNKLREIGIESVDPKGAFYIFADIRKFNLSSEDFCSKLLYKGKVACVPGTAFGSRGEGFIRISYCYSIEELKKALNRIEIFINSFK